MRLINTTTYEFNTEDEAHERLYKKNAEYAILSHRWSDNEITFLGYSATKLKDPSRQSLPEVKKIVGACEKARQENPPLPWLWVDSCCINQKNEQERGDALNSMYNWYKRAAVCYVYLSDVDWSAGSAPNGQMFKRKGTRGGVQSVWFDRGWTLQELLVPQKLNFYSCEWIAMGTKTDLAQILQQITRIDEKYLTGENDFRVASIAHRLSWMAGRTTTNPEDIAYSMFGVFDVNMPILYGEGRKAFLRFQRELIKTSQDESIFAWTAPANGRLACFRPNGEPLPWTDKTCGVLAPSPDCFLNSHDVLYDQDKAVPRLRDGWTYTPQGTKLEVSMRSGNEFTNWFGLPRNEVEMPLNCWKKDDRGALCTVVIHLSKNRNGYQRSQLSTLEMKKNVKPSDNRVLSFDQQLTRSLLIAQKDL